jgi:hypothetical protein
MEVYIVSSWSVDDGKIEGVYESVTDANFEYQRLKKLNGGNKNWGFGLDAYEVIPASNFRKKFPVGSKVTVRTPGE